jgi:hypothetical protein
MFCKPISFFEKMRYKVKCLLDICLHRVIYLVLRLNRFVSYSQLFTTIRLRTLLCTTGVKQWNFNPISRKSICLILPEFIFILFSTTHSHKESRSFCDISMLYLFEIFLYILQSPGKSLIFDLIYFIQNQLMHFF